MLIKSFHDARFGRIRTSVTNNGEPLFCLKDICDALALKNHRMVKQRLNPKGVNTSYPLLTQGGKQNATFINEPNLYRCIFQSKKKEAVEFQDWVFEEVLPALRNQVRQSALPALSSSVAELGRLEEENLKLKTEIERLRKTAEPTFKTCEIAKELGVAPQELYYRLRQLYVMRWDEREGCNVLHWELQGNGFTELVRKVYRYRDGSEREYSYWAWTRKGREYLLCRLFNKSVDHLFPDEEDEKIFNQN